MDIAELKQKSVAELHALAEKLNITNLSGLVCSMCMMRARASADGQV